jgi:peptidoglycan/LPS O-acetylase OafA/YrhL
VEGLRAIAVLLVVLFHAGVPGLSGGFVGVDVFFVISGFVITGLLLRERQESGRTSVIGFYARRCRRILPAATLVIVVTVLATYRVLGSLLGDSVANDGRWAAAFLVNFHFASQGTNYFSSALPPSPLQNYWSLSVEEQFYVFYPTIILVVARVKSRVSLRSRLTVTLGMIVAASYCFSIVQTAAHPTVAYFSPFARAWELALGGLVAVAGPWLKHLPRQIAAFGSWAGVAAICFAGLAFDSTTIYPGSMVAIPVVGAALIIAGGTSVPSSGAEALLGTGPLQWLGRRSFSLYLWHWPILIIAAERVGKSTLSLSDNLLLLLLAIVITMATYRFVENPIRHIRGGPRNQSTSVAAGMCLSVLTIGLMTVLISLHSEGSGSAASSEAGNSSASLPTVLRMVDAAPRIRTVPADITPSVDGAYFDFGIPSTWVGCDATYGQVQARACSFGDPQGNHLMVLYGDSHALMWARAFNDVAIRAKWRFVLLSKPGCPVDLLPIANPSGWGTPGGEWVACDQWRQNAIRRINRLEPDLLVVTQQTHPLDSPEQWQMGLKRVLTDITSPRTTKVVLGNIPRIVPLGPQCLSEHPDDVQACSRPANESLPAYQRAERAASSRTGSRYVDVMPWFCSRICTSIIGHFGVYAELSHVTNSYAEFLEPVLAKSLGLTAKAALPAVKPDLHTVMALPKSGATLLGTQPLDAGATDNLPVTRVQFRISGGALADQVIGVGTRSLDGWIYSWDTTTVPNGTYGLQSVAFDSAGKSALSKVVRINVDNAG